MTAADASRTYSRPPDVTPRPTSASAYSQLVRGRGRWTSRCLPGPGVNATFAATSFHRVAALEQSAVVRTASTAFVAWIRTAPWVCSDQKSATSWSTRSATCAAVVPSGVEPSGRTVTTVTWLVYRRSGTGAGGGGDFTIVGPSPGGGAGGPAPAARSPGGRSAGA